MVTSQEATPIRHRFVPHSPSRRLRGRILLKLVSAALFAVLAPTVGFCLDVKNYQVFRQSKSQSDIDLLNLWIDGMIEGTQAVNSALEANKMEKLFCAPPLTRKLTFSTIDGRLKRNKYRRDASVSVVLVDALQEVFSCTEP